MTPEITLQEKDASITNEMLRTSGKLPVIYYGNGKEAVQGVVEYVDFLKLYREAGESTMITLKTAKGNLDALVQDFQKDAISGKLLHVDFKLVEAGKPIEVTVPLEFVGTSPAAKSGLGTVTKALHEIDIKVLPKDLPHSITVDISSLVTADDQILVKDIKVPNTITVLTDAESAVVVIAAIKEETGEESNTIDFSQIEVKKKGKVETEETEA
jgi:large subunit ribosomal protein L25